MFGLNVDTSQVKKQLIHLVWTIGLFVAPLGPPVTAQGPQLDWSSLDRWNADSYTSALFTFLRQYLPEQYLFRHFELVEVYRAPALTGVATISFRLRYGDDLAFTAEAAGDPGTPKFISGRARVTDRGIEAYAGPLADYEIGTEKKKAREILEARGATTIAIPGARQGKELELWIHDYYQSSDPAPKKLGIFWIGGIKGEGGMEWYWVSAQDGALKITPRLLPH